MSADHATIGAERVRQYAATAPPDATFEEIVEHVSMSWEGAPPHSKYIAEILQGPEPDPVDRSSWWPNPLTRPATDRPVPTILERVDGIHLVYRGKVHAFVGESESAKTWGALLAVQHAITAGDHVLIVDFEDDQDTAWERLSALGVDLTGPQGRLVHFAAPDEPLLDRQGRWTRAQRDLDDLANDIPLSLVIFDGVTEGMGLDGLNPLDNSDIAVWYRHGARRLTRTPNQPAAVLVDHVVKDKEGRGRYALGGVHKLNGLDGAAYLFNAVEPFGVGRIGTVTLTVAKDRPGQVRRHQDDQKRIATLRLTSDPDTGAITTALTLPDSRGPISDDFEPTHLMEKVSRRCELYPGASKRDLRTIGKSEYVDKAIERLVALGHLEVRQVGRAHQHHSLSPYREHPEPPEDHPV